MCPRTFKRFQSHLLALTLREVSFNTRETYVRASALIKPINEDKAIFIHADRRINIPIHVNFDV